MVEERSHEKNEDTISVHLQVLNGQNNFRSPVLQNPARLKLRSFEMPMRGQVRPPSKHSFPRQGADICAGKADVGYLKLDKQEDIFIYRVLYPEDKVGGVIGHEGSTVKTMEHETGCELYLIGDMFDMLTALSPYLAQ